MPLTASVLVSNSSDRALVLEVHKHVALAVERRLLGLAAKRHRADDLFGRGVNRGRIGAPAVEGENALGLRIVNDGVGVFAGGLDLREWA